MDMIAALANELRKMFLGDAFLTIGAVLTVVVLAVLLKAGALPTAVAPFLLAAAVITILITAVNVAIFKTIRKSAK